MLTLVLIIVPRCVPDWMIDNVSGENRESGVGYQLFDCFIHAMLKRSRRVTSMLPIWSSRRYRSPRLVIFCERSSQVKKQQHEHWAKRYLPAAYGFVTLWIRPFSVELVNMYIGIVNNFDRVSSTRDWTLSAQVIRRHRDFPFVYSRIVAET